MAATALSRATPRLRVSAVVEEPLRQLFTTWDFQQQTEEGLEKSPVTVIKTTFQPLPPETKHDRKHESPLFLLFHSTACLNILVSHSSSEPHPNGAFSRAMWERRPPCVDSLPAWVVVKAAGAFAVSTRGDADRLLTVSTFVHQVAAPGIRTTKVQTPCWWQLCAGQLKFLMLPEDRRRKPEDEFISFRG